MVSGGGGGGVLERGVENSERMDVRILGLLDIKLSMLSKKFGKVNTSKYYQ